MTLTPAQLDAIATKLLGWTPTRCPIHGTSCPEAYYRKPDGTRGHGFLDVESPAAAMLVLEAMGKWCECPMFVDLRLDTSLKEPKWVCEVLRGVFEMEPKNFCWSGWQDTPAAAVFACAAKLVERMSP